MTSLITNLLYILLFAQICLVIGQDIIKSSLTFVIDDTGSMYDEIDQVKQSVNSIFDTVVMSKDSQIQNFVLVTFNDPDAHLLTITEDRNEFKRALASISIHGGDDCPEYAMTGIKIALEKSLPLSMIYVYTDATAKDNEMIEEIKSMSQKKQIQVTFVLTGDCGSRSDVGYQVYKKLAKATNGAVYNVMKHDVKEILNFVKENIKGRRHVIASETYPPGYGHKLNVTVDSKTDEVIISATGVKPKIEVLGPEGKEAKTESIVNKKEIAIVKVKDSPSEIKVGSESETSVTVTGKTSVNIQHGFSLSEPTSLLDTATRPPPDGKSHLSIKLQGDGVKLDIAQILDMSDKVVHEFDLRLIDERNKFYVTELFVAPTTMFKIAVIGHDEKDGSLIKRIAATPIERQNPKHETIENVAPVVEIVGENKITVVFNAPLQLKCKIRGHPKPDITWQEKDTGVVLPASVSTIEAPNYISILNVKNVKNNGTYECKATNSLGVNTKPVEVDVKLYFNVIEAPKEVINIEYGLKGRIICKVEASPPADITWYKDGRPLSHDANVMITGDMVIIQHMDLESQGNYVCEARNSIKRKLFHSEVFVSGLVEPKIYKNVDEIYVVNATDAELSCRITQGIPRPTIQWYFQRYDSADEKFQEINATGEILQLKHLTIDNAGTYKCSASNVVGVELYAMDVIVKYPPKIKDDHLKRIQARDNEVVSLPCDVDGVPSPTVKWLKDGKILHSTDNIRITTNHSLKFREIMVFDSGHYTCVAENELGSTTKSLYLKVHVPVNIEIPKVTTVETMVGRTVMLACRADGYPVPDIKWIFNDFDGKSPPKYIRRKISTSSLTLRQIQLRDQGYYTCVASNVGGSSNITFEVKVYAPPIIENIYKDRTFKSIKGDLALRIQCRASGSPEPTIIWRKNDLNIASGSEWYDIDNGTLIVKNIDEKSQGSYLCLAQNTIGSDSMIYDVVVKDYPVPSAHVSTKFIEKGKAADIACDIPHKNVDLLRWYKDLRLLTVGELKIHHATRRDEGLYSCRVSNNTKSLSAHVKVALGEKPSFITEEEEIIDFIPGDFVPLICEARGEPELTVSWELNGRKMEVPSMNYDLEMMVNNIGTYTCTVSNEVGSIQRYFKIVSQDCILDTRKDFLSNNQPIMLSTSLTWPTFTVEDGYMLINKDELFYLHCPKGFNKFPLHTVRVFCEGETKVKINGNVYEYSDIKCVEDIKLTVGRNGTSCSFGETEYLQIGYKVLDNYLNVYDVCLDKENNIPLFTRHQLSPAQYNVSNDKANFSPHELLRIDFDNMYDCRNQFNDITAVVGRGYDSRDGCCFDKMQLVNPKDLRPGVPTSAAYTYLNVVPHWSTCSSKNWEDVEERVRGLAKSLDHDLVITTGIAKLRMPRHSHHKDIVLHDKRGRGQHATQYVWKVVQDIASSSSLAIIQVNVPNLSKEEAISYVRCKDICNEVEWMRGTDWHNLVDGFTFCCSISTFESAFGYYKKFSREGAAILNFAPFTAESYYSI